MPQQCQADLSLLDLAVMLARAPTPGLSHWWIAGVVPHADSAAMTFFRRGYASADGN